MGWVVAAGLIDHDSATAKILERERFLGESSGPYFWGKEKHTPGILGSQGILRRGVVAQFEFLVRIVCVGDPSRG